MVVMAGAAIAIAVIVAPVDLAARVALAVPKAAARAHEAPDAMVVSAVLVVPDGKGTRGRMAAPVAVVLVVVLATPVTIVAPVVPVARVALAAIGVLAAVAVAPVAVGRLRSGWGVVVVAGTSPHQRRRPPPHQPMVRPM